jgi:uncharacterized protein (TIGR02246 family)
MRRFAACLAALLIAQAPARAPAQAPDATPLLPSVSLPPELERVLRDYERAWLAGDAAALTALFTEDGFVLSNGRPPVRGHAAIRAAYQSAGGTLRLRALAYAVQDTLGYIIGAYAYGSNTNTGDAGKFVLALRRTPDGAWRIVADIDNTNRRGGGAP